ncbi:Lipoprotein [Tumidithrix helvetica PCC 7403]|uniref:hypothetical protein n=1 Tax=Tumidithrix helvetica TaxID=3457545 RepID=UPI003C96579B
MKNPSISTIAFSLAIATTACQIETPPVAITPATTPSVAPKTAPSVQNEAAYFNEAVYLIGNPDVADLIKQGKYKSGLEHYTTVGKTTKKPDGEDYETFYTGTSGNDTVQGLGYGKHAHFVGVGLEVVKDKKVPFPLRPESLGKGEVDVLIGNKGGGGNEFLLGSFITPVNPKSEPFYVGKGDADYARIQNFTKSKDVIILAGELSQYKLIPKESNLQIATADGDLVAIVEGVDKLELGDVVKDFGVFTLK